MEKNWKYEAKNINIDILNLLSGRTILDFPWINFIPIDFLFLDEFIQHDVLNNMEPIPNMNSEKVNKADNKYWILKFKI